MRGPFFQKEHPPPSVPHLFSWQVSQDTRKPIFYVPLAQNTVQLKKPKISKYFKKSLKIVTYTVFAPSSSIILPPLQL